MAESLETLIKAGQGQQDAIALGGGAFMSKGIANAYLVTTKDGDVLINTGLDSEAPEIKSRFGRVSQGPLRVILFTQGHPDHVGGWSQFTGPGIETVAQANHSDVREYWHRLHPFYARRILKLWGAVTDADTSYQPPEPVLTRTFLDSLAFELGGRRFELFATPGGEATDSLVVWLPLERTVFVGNLLGPMFGHVPNLYTIRGDKVRSAIGFIHGLDRVIALEPETLVNGHDVFRGAAEIKRTLTKVRNATAYLRDRTLEGMDAGKDLWTLMTEISLPAELSLPQVHGKVAWIVRAIWEEHTGWFRYESTTELYAVPASDLAADLLDLSGGPEPLTERAQQHAAAGRALPALHLTDVVLRRIPDHLPALQVKRKALSQLLAASGRENFSEVQWLQSEIAAIDAVTS